MAKQLNKGELIPEITLKDQNGDLIDLRSFIGKSALIVYFYPKDETPGCTAEACSFRDGYEDFEEAGAKVIGISSDSVSSHKKFAEKYRLNFTLLSDPHRNAEKAFGVPRNFLGLLPGRVTYVFDKSGQLLNSFSSQLQATRHKKEALKALNN